MTREYSRARRIAQEMQKKIAIILQCEIKDPRISMATVSGIKVSRDLAYARVFVTFLNKNTNEQVKTGIKVLQDATGFIRSSLAKAIRLRVVPELIFAYDNSLIEGIRLSKLVSQIVQNDRLRRSASSANNKGSENKECC